MKNYVEPKIIVINFNPQDIIAATFTESGDDNETGWLDKWNSGILSGNN